MITGNIIPFNTYMERTSKMVRDEAKTKLNPDEQSTINKLADALDEIKIDWGKSVNDPEKDPNIIHLENVSIFDPNGRIDLKGALWRGNLDSVDGFLLGSIMK
jgi:hypothetical protein